MAILKSGTTVGGSLVLTDATHTDALDPHSQYKLTAELEAEYYTKTTTDTLLDQKADITSIPDEFGNFRPAYRIVANGDILKGDPLFLNSDSTVSTRDATQLTTSSFATLFTEDTRPLRDFKIVKLTDTRFVAAAVLQNGGSTFELINIVYGVSGSTITELSRTGVLATVFRSAAENCAVWIDRVNDTTVASGMAVNGHGSLPVVAATLSGNTLTGGSLASFSLNGEDLVVDADTKVFIGGLEDGYVFVAQETNISGVRGSLFSVSGNTLTLVEGFSIDISIFTPGKDSALFSRAPGDFILCSRSGTTGRVSRYTYTGAGFSYAGTITFTVAGPMSYYSDGTYLFGVASGQLRRILMTNLGQSISGAELGVDSEFITQIDNSIFVNIDSSERIGLFKYDVSSSAGAPSPTQQLTTSSNQDYISIGNTIFYFNYGSVTYPDSPVTYASIDVVPLVYLKDTMVGVASENTLSTFEVSALQPGSTLDGFVNLDVGVPYYVSSSGTYTQTDTGFLIGVAISPTTILLQA